MSPVPVIVKVSFKLRLTEDEDCETTPDFGAVILDSAPNLILPSVLLIRNDDDARPLPGLEGTKTLDKLWTDSFPSTGTVPEVWLT